jgi:hypothetical protein
VQELYHQAQEAAHLRDSLEALKATELEMAEDEAAANKRVVTLLVGLLTCTVEPETSA